MKWGTKWYRATILNQINEKEVEVEFINHDYEPEIVSISDTKALKVSSNSLCIKSTSIAGAFNRKCFESFVKDIMKDNYFVTPLSIDVDLNSSFLSRYLKTYEILAYSHDIFPLFLPLPLDSY